MIASINSTMPTDAAFAHTPRPTYSAWGHVDQADEVAAGIWLVSTPSHGGFLISQQRRDAMPRHLREFQPHAGDLAYEEDCDWCVVVLAFPGVFTGLVERANAQAAYAHWIAPKVRT